MNQAQPFLTSGQVALQAGISRGALRLYEKFGLIVPILRTEAGYRMFAPEAVITLKAIKVVSKAGFTLAEIRDLLSLVDAEPFSPDAMNLALSSKITEIEQRVDHLLHVKRFLIKVSADPEILIDPNCDAMLELALQASAEVSE